MKGCITMGSLKNKKAKFNNRLAILIAIILFTGMLLLFAHSQFGAKIIPGYGENQYGDFAELEYDGNLYAYFSPYTRYRVLEIDKKLTRIRTDNFFKTIFHKYKAYSLEDDPEHTFLICNTKLWGIRELEPFYRLDYVFPKLQSDNIEKIRIYTWDDILLFTLEDKEMIKYFLDEKTSISYNDIISFIEGLEIKKNSEKLNISEDAYTLYVYAKFKDSPLHYALGTLNETDRKYYEYGETDDTNDYDGYDVFE